MRSMFLVLSACTAVANAAECQATEEATLLQLQRVRGHQKNIKVEAKITGAKGLVTSLTHIAHNLQNMDTVDVNAALDQAAAALATLSPAIQQQVGFLQASILDAAAAVEACHNSAGVEQRAALWIAAEEQAAASVACEAELAQAMEDEASICSAASVADVQSTCACEEAEVRRQDKEELCAALRTVYENGYCEHNLQCTTYHECHGSELAVYNQIKADVEAEMVPIEEEYVAAEQSSCILAIIQASMAPGGPAIDFDAINACETVNTNVLLVVYPELPGTPEACPAPTHGNPQCVTRVVVFDEAHSQLTASPGAITGTGQMGWNKPANSAWEVTQDSGICGISFKCNTPESHLMLGLAHTQVTRWQDLDYGITCRGSWTPALDTYENAHHRHRLSSRPSNGNPTADVYAIFIDPSGQVQYKLNGEVYYTSSRAVTYPWHVGLDTYTAPSLSDVEYLSCGSDGPVFVGR